MRTPKARIDLGLSSDPRVVGRKSGWPVARVFVSHADQDRSLASEIRPTTANREGRMIRWDLTDGDRLGQPLKMPGPVVAIAFDAVGYG